MVGYSEILGLSQDYVRSVLAAVLAVFLGLMLKLAAEWDKDRLTWKRAFVQSVFSSGVGYMVFLSLGSGTFLGLRLELWLCITSFAAAHIIGALDTVSKAKAKTVIENMADKLIAKHHSERSKSDNSTDPKK